MAQLYLASIQGYAIVVSSGNMNIVFYLKVHISIVLLFVTIGYCVGGKWPFIGGVIGLAITLFMDLVAAARR